MGSVQRHSYHLVDLSPWPMLSGVSAIGLTVGFVMYMHRVSVGGYILLLSLCTLVGVMSYWWRDVVREGSYLGHHTEYVQQGLKYGMILFIVSEVMFFFAFFWGFFTSSLVPGIEIGSIWPPVGINILETWQIPFLNTLLLLLSGCTITWAHHSLREGEHFGVIWGFEYTLMLAILFTAMQFIEYDEASYNISDSIYGTTFFMLTGFHGFHVLVGTLFIAVCWNRHMKDHFTRGHHVGFEAAAWYWHFVDVVWLFLFTFVYWWGGLSV